MEQLGAGDALLLVDVQHDFLPGGALAVPQGDRVLAPLSRAVAAFADLGLPIFASRDWHPPTHCSFHAQGGPWPPHCVAGTRGAEFALTLPPSAIVISKATRPEEEAYSAFAGTKLEQTLREAGVRRLFVGGLATDYCVRATVRDALAAGFEVVLLTDAVAAVDSEGGARALEEMRRLGARLIDAASAFA